MLFPYAAGHAITLLLPLAPLVLYLGLVAVVAMLAVLHPQRDRRGEARRVLTDLLSILRRRQ